MGGRIVSVDWQDAVVAGLVVLACIYLVRRKKGRPKDDRKAPDVSAKSLVRHRRDKGER